MREERPLNRKQRASLTAGIIIAIVIILLLCIGNCKGCVGNNEDSSNTSMGGEISSSSTVSSEYISSEIQSNPEPVIQEKVEAVVTIDNRVSIYGDPIKELEWKVEIREGNIGIEELSKYIVISKQGEDTAGTYPIVGECLRDDWQITFIEGEYTIYPKDITVIADDQQSYVGEKVKPLTYKLDGTLAGGDKAEELFSLETTATGKSAGTFDITINAKENPNYRITATNGVYTVKQKPNTSQGSEKPSNPSQLENPKTVKATVTINSLSSIYGDALKKLTWTTKVDSGDITVDELNKYITVSKAEGNNAGEYAITGKCSKSDWKVTFINGTYTIEPRSITVTANNQESYVGEKLKSLTYKLDGKLAGSDKAEDLFSIETKATGYTAGKFDITVKAKGNSNYRITTKNGVYTVNPKPIIATVTINSLSSTYGEALKKLTWTTKVDSGDITVDELNKYITVSKAEGNNAGKYAITGKCSKSDWKVTFINGTYKIEPRSISVTANNQESYVGESLKSLTYRLDGRLVGSDKAEDLFSITTTATGKTAGTFDIRIISKGNQNYRITSQNGVYTVKEKTAEPDIPDENETPAEPGVPSDDDDDIETPTKPGPPSDDDDDIETPTKPGPPSDDDDIETPTKPGPPSDDDDIETPTKPGPPSDDESETPTKPGPPSDDDIETPTKPGLPSDDESETPAKPGVPEDDDGEIQTPTRPSRSNGEAETP